MRRLLTAYLAILGGQVSAQLLSGFGQTPYMPLCAESCLRSLSSLMLDCTVMDDRAGGHSHMAPTTPDCFAENTPFLTTLAWCMRTKCAEHNVANSEIQHFWELKATSSSSVPAKWSYAEALTHADPSPPTYKISDTDVYLNESSLVNDNTYLAQWNVLGNVQYTAIKESAYG